MATKGSKLKAPWAKTRKVVGGFTVYGHDKNDVKVRIRTKRKADAEAAMAALEKGITALSVSKALGKVDRTRRQKNPTTPWMKIRKVTGGYTAYGADANGNKLTLTTRLKGDAEKLRDALAKGASAVGKSKALGKVKRVTRVKRKKNPPIGMEVGDRVVVNTTRGKKYLQVMSTSAHAVRAKDSKGTMYLLDSLPDGSWRLSAVKTRKKGVEGTFIQPWDVTAKTPKKNPKSTVGQAHTYRPEAATAAIGVLRDARTAEITLSTYFKKLRALGYTSDEVYKTIGWLEMKGITTRVTPGKIGLVAREKNPPKKPRAKKAKKAPKKNPTTLSALGKRVAKEGSWVKVSGGDIQFRWQGMTHGEIHDRRYDGSRSKDRYSAMDGDKLFEGLTEAKKWVIMNETIPRLRGDGYLKNPKKAPKKAPKRAISKKVTKADIAKLNAIFVKLISKAAEKRPLITVTKLYLRSDVHDTARHFTYTKGKSIYVAPELLKQSKAVITGVLAHELGHVIRNIDGKKALASYDAEERAADKAGEALCGVKVYYNKAGVQTTSKATRPRPAGLR